MPRRSLPLLAGILLAAILTACEEPPSRDGLLEEAQRLTKEGRAEEALERMRELVAIAPDDPRVQRQYGEALMATGQPSLAVWPLARAMNDPEEARAAGVLLAHAQLAAGSADDALQTASRLIELDPEDPAFYELRSRAHLLLNMEEQAIEDIDAAVERGFDDEATAGFIRVYALLGLGEVDEAEALLEALHAQAVEEVEEKPRRAAEVCGATALFAHEKGDDELAAERFNACLEGEGMRNRLLVKTALEFFDGSGRRDEGTELLKRRFEADEQNLSARVAYAQRLQRSGRAQDAEALLMEATETQPPAWSALADLHLARQDFAQALDALERAIEAHPNPPDSWQMSRADFLILLGRLADAEQVLEEDIELDVHRSVIRGRLALARGDVDAAAESLEQALVMWPDNPDVRYLAATAYERKGSWPKAISHYREAARQEPPHIPSSRALAEIQKALGDSEGRAFVLARLLQVHPKDADALEGLIEEASNVGSRELAQQMFWRLSRVPGQRGRAIAAAARSAARNAGPEAGLRAIDAARLDLSQPDLFEALETRSELLVTLDRRDVAIAELDSLIASSAPSSALLAHRSGLRLGKDDVTGARSDAERAVELTPDSIPSLLALASALEASGDRAGARPPLERAVGLEETRPAQEADAVLALAGFELRSKNRREVDAGRARLRTLLAERPRSGRAALLLLESLLGDDETTDSSREIIDLAQRSALFDASPRARELWARYAPEKDPFPIP
jgi:tetratricopeptide (TPR) repeat protein